MSMKTEGTRQRECSQIRAGGIVIEYNTKSFGLTWEDAQDKEDLKTEKQGPTSYARLSWKMAIKQCKLYII